jgi:hypothetical protein
MRRREFIAGLGTPHGQNSVWRRDPHRDAGTRKKAERENRRADNHSGHRPLAATAKSRFIVASISS